MNTRRWTILGWALVVAACAPLIVFRGFGLDWFNHVWAVNYYAEIFREAGAFPSMFNVGVVEVGWCNLYAWLLYPVLALPASVVGADLAVRLLAAGLFVASYAVWTRLGARLIGAGPPAVLCGLAAALPVYALTNLYPRSALPEFFAQMSLTLAMAGLVRWLAQGAWPRPAPLWCIAASFLGLILVVGSHPITAYLSGPVLGPGLVALALAMRWRPSRAQLVVAIGGIGFAVVLCARWLSDAATWMNQLELVSKDIAYQYLFDGPWQRLAPIPVDPRLWSMSWDTLVRSTPFLEGHVNVSLFLVALAGAWLVHRRGSAAGGGARRTWVAVWILSGGAAVLVLVASLDPSLFTGNAALEAFVRRVLRPLQFPYRLAGVIQLLFVLLFLLAGWRLRVGEAAADVSLDSQDAAGAPLPAGWNRFLRVVLAITVLAVLVKVGTVLGFTRASQHPQLDAAVEHYHAIITNTQQPPYTFYGIRGYTLRGGFARLTPPLPSGVAEVKLTREASRAGRTAESELRLAGESLVRTNVVLTPLVRVVVDERVVPLHEMYSVEGFAVLRLPAGAHRVRAEIEPGRHAWNNAVVILWTGAALAVTAWGLIATRRERRVTSAA